MEPGSGASAPPLLSRRALFRKKLSAKQLTLFTRQLATLVQVSPLEESLRTIARQSEQEQVRRILGSVHGAVVEGRRLSEARSEEHTSELQSLMRISYAVFCLQNKTNQPNNQ